MARSKKQNEISNLREVAVSVSMACDTREEAAGAEDMLKQQAKAALLNRLNSYLRVRSSWYNSNLQVVAYIDIVIPEKEKPF